MIELSLPILELQKKIDIRRPVEPDNRADVIFQPQIPRISRIARVLLDIRYFNSDEGPLSMGDVSLNVSIQSYFDMK